MDSFDLLVIGGGPGGYLCAERAAQGGMKVALFEERSLGGTCLNEGCIPTKTLLNSAKILRHAREGEAFGVYAGQLYLDHEKVVARKDQVVKTLVSGVQAKMRTNKVCVISARAMIRGRTGEGFAVEAAGNTYTGKRLVVASGSEPVVPPTPGVKEGLSSGFVLTNRELLAMTEVPKHLVVIGGGVIGLEMAFYFGSIGTQVTVIEMMPKIAGNLDPDMCQILQKSCEKQNLRFCLSAKVLSVGEGKVEYEISEGKQTISCDKVLLSAGRRASTRELGLETLGIQLERGAIVTDRHLCTNVSGVYAIGDCNGKLMLAHTAYREAEVAVNHMLGISDEMRYDIVPSVIYTDPEVACVGLDLCSAREKGFQVREVKLPMSYSGRYLAENSEGNGFIKLVIDTQKQRLLGCQLIGAYASEIIMTATMMVDTELSPKRLQKLVFPHPTVAEIIREAIFQ